MTDLVILTKSSQVAGQRLPPGSPVLAENEIAERMRQKNQAISVPELLDKIPQGHRLVRFNEHMAYASRPGKKGARFKPGDTAILDASEAAELRRKRVVELLPVTGDLFEVLNAKSR